MNRRYVALILVLNLGTSLQCMLLSRNLRPVAALMQNAALKPASTECHDRVAAIATTPDMKYRLKAYAALMERSQTVHNMYNLSPFDVMSEEEKMELKVAYLTGTVALMRCWGKAQSDKQYSFRTFFLKEVWRSNPSLFSLKSSILIENRSDIRQWDIHLHCSVGDLCDTAPLHCDATLIDTCSFHPVERFHETLCTVAKNIDSADPLAWFMKHKK